VKAAHTRRFMPAGVVVAAFVITPIASDALAATGHDAPTRAVQTATTDATDTTDPTTTTVTTTTTIATTTTDAPPTSSATTVAATTTSGPTTTSSPPSTAVPTTDEAPIVAQAVEDASGEATMVCSDTEVRVQISNTGTEPLHATASFGQEADLAPGESQGFRWPIYESDPSIGETALEPAFDWSLTFFDGTDDVVVAEGGFIVDAYLEVCGYLTGIAPNRPQNLVASPDDGSVLLTWDAPAENAAAIDTVVIERDEVDGGPTGFRARTLIAPAVLEPVASVDRFTFSYRDESVDNGRTYEYRVVSVNQVGSAASDIVRAVPRTVPSPPTDLTASLDDVTQVLSLHWQPPDSNGGAPVTDYIIEQSPDGATDWTTLDDGVGTDLSYDVGPVTIGEDYFFRVSARNEAGDSAPTPVLHVRYDEAATPPSRPRQLRAMRTGDGAVVLTWLAPARPGDRPVTDYVVQQSSDGASGWTAIADVAAPTTTFTVDGLAPGTRYWFRVVAVSAAGSSPPSNVVTRVPRTVPSAPELAAIAGNRRALLVWTPAASNGLPVRRYVVQISTDPSAGWTTVATRPRWSWWYVARGLTNGTTYYFRVAARNGVGLGAWSPVASIVPGR
jgi:Fibronectin type III domain